MSLDNFDWLYSETAGEVRQETDRIRHLVLEYWNLVALEYRRIRELKHLSIAALENWSIRELEH